MTDINLNDLLRLDGRAFVNTAYLAILKRPADESGMRTYLHHLSQGARKEQLVLALAQSPEAMALSQPNLDVTPLIDAERRSRGNGLVALFRRKKRNKPQHAGQAIERIESAIAELHHMLMEQQQMLAEQLARLNDVSLGSASSRQGPLDTLLADARQATGGVSDAGHLIENLSHVVRSSALARSFLHAR
jgi:hypothetical protein